jgi:hypothetical protein
MNKSEEYLVEKTELSRSSGTLRWLRASRELGRIHHCEIFLFHASDLEAPTLSFFQSFRMGNFLRAKEKASMFSCLLPRLGRASRII